MEDDHASQTLREIITASGPSPRFAPYHNAYAKRLRKARCIALSTNTRPHACCYLVLASFVVDVLMRELISPRKHVMHT